MNYVMTVQVSKLRVYHGSDGDECAPKNVLEKAFVLDDFDAAKKKFRETVSELVTSCKFFPYSGKQYKPLAEYCKECDYGPNDVGTIVSDELSKFLSDPDYSGRFPKDVWGFEDYTFITSKNEIYYNMDGKILHSNAISMADSQATYFFDYREMDCGYEPEHAIRIFLKPADIQ